LGQDEPSPSETNGRAALEALLLRVARESSREAFADLFRHFAPRLKGYLLRLGADDSEAEEIAQDVMVTVWRKADQFDPTKAGVSTWVFRIARNRRIDVHRRTSKPELDADEPMLRPPDPVAPEAMLGRAEADAAVRSELSGLPSEQVQLLRAAFYEGLSHSEIAERYNLPLGTVKSRIRLGFTRLRARLEAPD